MKATCTNFCLPSSTWKIHLFKDIRENLFLISNIGYFMRTLPRKESKECPYEHRTHETTGEQPCDLLQKINKKNLHF